MADIQEEVHLDFCQICTQSIVDTPKMTLLCNHSLHTRCYLIHNIYTCMVCNEYVITNALRDEMENMYVNGNTFISTNRDTINNLYKTNKKFKLEMNNYKKVLKDMRLANKELKMDAENLKNSSSLHNLYLIYNAEKKRILKEIPKLSSFKKIRALINKLKNIKNIINTTYDVSIERYNPKIDNANKLLYIRGFNRPALLLRSHALIYKIMRNIQRCRPSSPLLEE